MSKEWDPYFNEYQDRGIIKWQGFFLSEHTSALDRLKKEDEEIPRLPQQSKQAIDHYLSRSMKQNKVIEVQLNTLDDLGRVKPSLVTITAVHSSSRVAFTRTSVIPSPRLSCSTETVSERCFDRLWIAQRVS